MADAAVAVIDGRDRDDMDPGVRALLDRKAERISSHPVYQPLSTADVEQKLISFFATEKPGCAVGDVARMGGGASKEQFLFSLTDAEGAARYVLRMDPIQTAAETDRAREFEALDAYGAVVPAPRADWLDHDGARFGQPAAIMGFVAGVTKPTTGAAGPNVTGLGTSFSADLRDRLGPQYVRHLADFHNADRSSMRLPSFSEPRPGTTQAALWQINWMSRAWRDDQVQASPLMAVVERWLRRNLPVCDDAVMIHGDYRTGNFLFDEESGRITAILDWEWAHLGDFHEDLGWMLQRLWLTHQDGKDLVCGMMERQQLIDAYESASGRRVDPAALRWYEIYCAYKCYVITLATSIKAARDGANHQDVMLSWLAPAGYRFASDLCSLISDEELTA
jgi:aminoglycoside phosphotransferase (APT) family kinase protein